MSEQNYQTGQKENMTGKKVWFITGAGRGMGTDIAKAALAAGHSVVATGRNPGKGYLGRYRTRDMSVFFIVSVG